MNREQAVTFQMLNKTQTRLVKQAAEIYWRVCGVSKKSFGSRLQFAYDLFLQRYESKEQLLEMLDKLELGYVGS